MVHLLLGPLDYPFMRNGLLEVILLSTACGVIGPFVVLRKLTFFVHALSHTVFPALVVGYALRLSPLLAASVGAALTVGLVFQLQRRPSLRLDSVAGVVFVGLFALGVVLVGWWRIKSPDVRAAVTGDLLGTSAADLVAGGVLVVTLVLVVSLLYRPLTLVAFDGTARALGLPVALVDVVVLAAAAMTAVVSVRLVGVILTVAALVTPAAAARLWSAHLPVVMLLSTLCGALAGIVAYMARTTRASRRPQSS
jgi:ABC-type Mn2+/Zn2+ transport system permease subunit